MKLSNMVFIISGLMILFFLAGLNTSIGAVLGTLGLVENPSGIVGSTPYKLIFGVLTTLAVGGVVIGLFTRSQIENYLVAPLVLFFMLFLGDLISIYTVMNQVCDVESKCAWARWVVVAIIVPLALIFIMAIADWFRGRDS